MPDRWRSTRRLSAAELSDDALDVALLSAAAEVAELSAEFEDPEQPVMATATTRAIIEVVRKRMYIS